MKQEGIHVGAVLRVIRDRWDATAGTLAEVDTVRESSRFVKWCFTVRWHRPRPTKRILRRDDSLNLFESDLADFEVFTGPLPEIQSPPRRRVRGMSPVPPSPQFALPYIPTDDDFVLGRLDLEGFPLASDWLPEIDTDR
jgi:hypothetical protein